MRPSENRRSLVRTFGRLALIMVLAFAAGGCARTAAKGKVSGQVLLNGKPLRGGEVTFRSNAPNSVPVSASIDPSGNYSAVELPAGETIVSVDTRMLAPKAARGAPPLPPKLSQEARDKIMANRAKQSPSAPPPANDKYVSIPVRYANGEAGDELTFTVQAGDQTHNIELKSP